MNPDIKYGIVRSTLYQDFLLCRRKGYIENEINRDC